MTIDASRRLRLRPVKTSRSSKATLAETGEPRGASAGKSDVPGRDTLKDGVDLINAALSPSGAPVIGLHIYLANIVVLKSLTSDKAYHVLAPHLFATPAILSFRPGLSQTE